jgi:hypothetical protein
MAKQQKPDLQLQYKIGVASEHTYTKEDAIRNQYNKQYRFNLTIGDIAAGNYKDRTFALGSQSPEDIEAYHQKLQSEGLSNNIDWQGVNEDFTHLKIDLDNSQIVDEKIDYVASRYAVLKDRIEKDYSGDEQEAQTEQLNRIYEAAKTAIADSYAKTVGGFFEDNGAAGESEKMRSSLMLGIDNRSKQYFDYIKKNQNYAETDVGREQWLLHDDGYMAAVLRKSVSEKSETVTSSGGFKGQADYSLRDLEVAGTFVNQTMSQYNSFVGNHYMPNEEKTGLDLAVQAMKTDYMTTHTGISNHMASLINQSLNSYIEKYLDRMDKALEETAQRSSVPNMRSKLERQSVYQIYQYTMKQYKSSGNILKALADGAEYAQNESLRKADSDVSEWNRFFIGKNSNGLGRYESGLSEFQKYAGSIGYFINSLKSGNPKDIDLIIGRNGDISINRINDFSYKSLIMDDYA